MDLINHIPFGLRAKDQQFVDVADVPKGRKCGCICPSCHIPLIARQGRINRWHFAHASRKIEDLEQGCQYSFFVSVRAMAKQIIESGFQLSTPGCTLWVSERRYGIPFSEPFYVTKPDTITLSKVHKECLFEETMVDTPYRSIHLSLFFQYTRCHWPATGRLCGPVMRRMIRRMLSWH